MPYHQIGDGDVGGLSDDEDSEGDVKETLEPDHDGDAPNLSEPIKGAEVKETKANGVDAIMDQA